MPGEGLTDELGELMRYGKWLHGLAEPRQVALLGHLERAQRGHPAAMTQVRLAMVLALPGRTFADPQRALSLLRAVQADTSVSDDLKAFVGYRLALLNEQLASDSERLECTADLEQERRDRKVLQGQLDALKAIEKKMNASDKPQTVPLR